MYGGIRCIRGMIVIIVTAQSVDFIILLGFMLSISKWRFLMYPDLGRDYSLYREYSFYSIVSNNWDGVKHEC